MKHLPYIGLLIGFILLVTLLVWQGLQPVVALLLDSGWRLLWLSVVWLPAMLVGGIGWWYLFPRHRRPGWRPIMHATWLGHAINNLLPVASVGGDIARARLLQLWNHDGIEATASVVVDKTLQTVALMLWGLIGVSLLAILAIDSQLATVVLAGFLILTVCITAFILVQHAGMLGFMARLAERLFEHDFIGRLKNHAEQVDIAIRATYRRRRELALSIVWHTVSLILQAGEVWLGCYLLGQPIGLVEALLLKSLTSTISDIAFIIPNGYGIQEGAYIMIGALIGLSPAFALALALAIRIRDITIALPGLIHWQTIEGRQLLARRNN